MPDITELHRRAAEDMTSRVHAVGGGQWDRPTPCTEWSVRDLVNHVTYECLWTPPLMEGKTIADVGDAFEGDVLGADPATAWDMAAKAATEAIAEPGAMSRTVHLSFGDFPGSEYAGELVSDLLVHSWDLARGIGGDERLDPELVEFVLEWFLPREDAFRTTGLIGPRIQVPEDADPQTQLLAGFGRRS